MKKLLISLAILLALFVALYLFVRIKHSPTLDGEISLQGLSSSTDVLFDTYGVPHIYAASAGDAYRTLGYVHAQDRLFQMEMMRRVGNGSLAELLGEDLLDIDKFFHTIGIPAHAIRSTEEWQKDMSPEWKSHVLAYIDGVNEFIQNGSLPLEYTLLGHSPRTFTIEDIHAITGYMSFTFAMTLRTEPLVTKIHRQLGAEYLKVLSVHTLPEHHTMPVHYPQRDSSLQISTDYASISKLLEKLPVPLLMGSNAWVIAGSKTQSGEVLFCNDTHIGFAQPSVWYEAHLEYPGFSIYGNHLAGLPFPLVGHSREHSVGLTMFENDDWDLFEEKINPENPNEVVFKDGFSPITERKVSIKVKGKDPVELMIRSSHHGPFINEVLPELKEITENPVASWWVYTLETTKALEATWKMGNAKDIQEMEAAVSLIHAPGLNVMYGDKQGNIAWWATAKLPIRPEHVNSKLLLDGTGKDEPLGWVDFKDNPMSINPPAGFVVSANNQPDTMANGMFYPGYYYPGDRYNRIASTIEKDSKWNQEKIKTLQLETFNERQARNMSLLLSVVGKEAFGDRSSLFENLSEWKGTHGVEEIAPTIYYRWLYHTLHQMMADEIGEESFETFLNTFMLIRSTERLLASRESPWWDNVNTDKTESRGEIILKALELSMNDLENQFGKNHDGWQWKKALISEHPHPLGAKKPLDKIFNVKSLPLEASEVGVNKLAFKMNKEGVYKVSSGPAMRIIIDFADVEASESVLPTGQSGNLFSPHYQDQVDLYATGQYRPQLMNRDQIEKVAKNRLTFK